MRRAEIHLIRHAPTADNVAGRFMGQADVPALPGAEAAALPATGERAVFCSPLSRARSSAAQLFPHDEVHVDARLSERGVGVWEGLDHAEVRARWPEGFRDGRIDPLFTPPGGESMTQLQERIVDFLASVAAMTVPVHVVTHNGWIRTARLLNGEISLAELFREPVPHLTPVPFALDLACVRRSRPFD